MNNNFESSPNKLESYLKKSSTKFKKEDIVKFIVENNIRMLNFHYVAEDGRLKTLNFIINNRDHLDDVLSSGERVDGSSLFSFIDARASDLYVIPRFKTAFIDPFSKTPTLSLLCSFLNAEGEPYSGSPEYILRKANNELKRQFNYSFEAMGELEYYIISKEDLLFPATDQKGYHESFPFNKTAGFRKEAMEVIAECGGKIKYAHSEVGNFVLNGLNYEQNEIEFLPVPVEDAADQLVIAKWILRNMAYKYGHTVTFSPKITVGKAGSGLHIHTRLMKDGENIMVRNGVLSDVAKKVIAGFLELAPSLTAFGNMNPTSYFRLVPHQEAPTTICWGDRNRSVLVRVPLGWTGKSNMSGKVNPLEAQDNMDFSYKQTVEFRCPDGSADVYLLLAGLTVAALYGLNKVDALEIAEKTYIREDILKSPKNARLAQFKVLPSSCYESANKLEEQKEFYTCNEIFPEDLIDQLIENLKELNDRRLRERAEGNLEELTNLVEKYFYCG